MPVRTIALRHGGTADANTVDTLMAAAFDPRFGEAWTRNQCMGVLAMPGVRLTLASVDERPVGFALVRTVMDEAELLLLAVTPNARRTGVGGALLRAIIAEAEQAGVGRIFLEVRANNDAVSLYQQHGFTRQGVRPAYYRGRDGEQFDAHSYARPTN